ncbi:hypothetical protein KAJ27_01520 [bacterium]|nr:hypothetical protein [bacterium]
MKKMIAVIFLFIFFAIAENAICSGTLTYSEKLRRCLESFETKQVFNVPYKRELISTDLIDKEISSSRIREFKVNLNNISMIQSLKIDLNNKTLINISTIYKKMIPITAELEIGDNEILITVSSSQGNVYLLKRKIIYNPIVLVAPEEKTTTFNSIVPFECWTGDARLTKIKIRCQLAGKSSEEYVIEKQGDLFKFGIPVDSAGIYKCLVLSDDHEFRKFKIVKKEIPFKVKLLFIGYNSENPQQSSVRLVDLNRSGNNIMRWKPGEKKFLSSGINRNNTFFLDKIIVNAEEQYCILKSLDLQPELNIKMYMLSKPTEYFENGSVVVPLVLEVDRTYIPVGEKAEFRISSNAVPVYKCNLRINDTSVTSSTPEGIYRYQFEKKGKYTILAEHDGNFSLPLNIEVGELKIGELKKFNLSFRELYKILYRFKDKELPETNEELTNFFNYLWPAISFDKHHSVGWVISKILSRDGESALKLVHLERGDIIRAIDGYKIDSAEERKRLWKSLMKNFIKNKDKRIMIFDIERSGNPLRIIYKFR